MREEAEAIDGVDDEEGDPKVEGHARDHREEDPRLPVGLPVVGECLSVGVTIDILGLRLASKVLWNFI